LREKSTKNITFFKDLSDRELGLLYTHTQALIMPQEEDFGYVSLEAQYFGCPVLAYGAGGACETVQSKKTGMLFTEQSTKGVCDAVAEFHTVTRSCHSSKA
jgi:glycosyltransferase involved in cell wall biosynthesis